MSAIEQSKEQFIVACMADGTAQEVCEARWNAAHETNPEVPQATTSSASTGPPPMGDEDIQRLLRENEMLKGQVAVREKQLRQALGIATRANDERKAKEEAEKHRLISSIMLDSRFSKDDLKGKSLSELQTIRITIDKSLEKTFASVGADIDAAARRRQPFLTAGAWDADKKRYVGGIS